MIYRDVNNIRRHTTANCFIRSIEVSRDCRASVTERRNPAELSEGSTTPAGRARAPGTVGAALARQQGISTLARLRKDLNDGRLPAEPIVDGVLILVAAAVLITPGVLTDLVGFLCLVPACRRLLKRYLKRRFERAVREGTVGVTVAVDGARDPSRRPPMRDVTPRRPADPDS